MGEQHFDQAQAKEIIRFQLSYNRRKIISTWVLAAIIVGIFLLEEYFGGSENPSVLVRMGANVSERVRQGEYYRLFTSVFLHAGFMHVFFNTYVLFALGGFFNRILGESKYLTVFLCSGVAGSLASLFFGKSTISVGASGAIWGLFGASLTLALFKTSLIPEIIRLRLRRVTLINLVINLGISFLPMIDFWAHLGGGIAGFVISLIFIIEPQNKRVHQIMTVGFFLSATILSLMYGAAFAYDLWNFKPWVNQLESKKRSVNFAPAPFIIDIPADLHEEHGPTNSAMKAYFTFGNPQIDQVVFEFNFIQESLLGKQANKAWLMAQRDDLLEETTLPAKIKKTVYYRDSLDGGVLYYQQPVQNVEMVIHNYVIVRNNYVIKTGIMTSEKITQSKVDKLAGDIIQTIRFSPSANSP